MKPRGFLTVVLGTMLFAGHVHALAVLPPGAIVSVVCPGGYGYNGQTGLITNVVIRNTAGTIQVTSVKIYSESGALLKDYSAGNPPPGFSTTLPELKMTALSGQAVFGNAMIGRVTTIIRYRNVTSPSASISEALVTATEIDFEQGRVVSRSTVVCR